MGHLQLVKTGVDVLQLEDVGREGSPGHTGQAETQRLKPGVTRVTDRHGSHT